MSSGGLVTQRIPRLNEPRVLGLATLNAVDVKGHN
jgi:hypothetical protein